MACLVPSSVEVRVGRQHATFEVTACCCLVRSNLHICAWLQPHIDQRSSNVWFLKSTPITDTIKSFLAVPYVDQVLIMVEITRPLNLETARAGGWPTHVWHRPQLSHVPGSPRGLPSKENLRVLPVSRSRKRNEISNLWIELLFMPALI